MTAQVSFRVKARNEEQALERVDEVIIEAKAPAKAKWLGTDGMEVEIIEVEQEDA